MSSSSTLRKALRTWSGFVLAGIAVLFAAAAYDRVSAQAPAQTDWICFPTCTVNDGKVLVVAGDDPTTLGGQEILIGINSSAAEANLVFGLFDGDATNPRLATSGVNAHWDNPANGATPPTLGVELWADPDGMGLNTPGTTATLVTTIPSAGFANNAWTDVSVPNVPAALNAGVYRYVLRLFALNTADAGWNGFKVRTLGTIGLRPQTFAFVGAATSSAHTLNDLKVIYPLYPTLPAPTTYDGKWRFSFAVPANLTSLSVYDGDLDYGNLLCTNNDTDDPDSSPFPAFPVVRVSGEGVAQGTSFCTGSTTQRTTGNPLEDFSSAVNRRETTTPGTTGVVYSLVDPLNTRFLNANPSGNREWEAFTLKKDTSVAEPECLAGSDTRRATADCLTPEIVAGIYEVQVDGVDLQNLNFWYFPYSALGVTESGTPACEDCFFRIGRLVWYDTDKDGTPDADEPVIPGVTVTVIDELQNIQTGVTGPDGQFFFRKPSGAYTIVVDHANFGGPLAGLRSTTGGEVKSGVRVDADVPYAEAIFGYVGNTAPVAEPDSILAACCKTATLDVLANDTDFDNNDLTITAVTQPTNGTATLNGDGTVTYVPTAGYLGSDSFTYTIGDGNGGTAIGTVSIEVINNLPTLSDDSTNAVYQTPITINVLANDSDPDGSPLSVQSITQPANGTAVLNPDGTVTYTPRAGFFGDDEFRYTVRDECGGEAEARVRITIPEPVLNVSAAPVCVNDTPYVNFSVAASNFTPAVGAPVTLTWKDSLGNIVQTNTILWNDVNAPVTGQVLWPGATVDGNGTPTDWPGWLFQGGEWIQGSDGFENTRPTATVEISVNPTTTVSLSYPPPTAQCASGPRSAISGFVYVDANNDGVKDGSESPIASTTVRLTGTDVNGDAVNRTAVTDGTGRYSFTGLLQGTYTVTESQPASYLDGKDTAGTTGGNATANDIISAIAVPAGAHSQHNNFGELVPATLSGFVYVDANNDGVKDGSEAPIGGVMLTLSGTDVNGASVGRTTTTSGSGFYEFTNLLPGTYSVTEAQPVVYLDGRDTAGSTGGSVATNDVIASTTLVSGANSVNNNFGEGLMTPAIALVKKTNGTDNNSAPGLEVAAGSTVTWTYLITNTGNVPLSNVTLTDDKLGAVSCAVSLLNVGASTTCTATGIAIAGQYTNIGIVTGTPPVGANVSAQDPDNYFGKTSQPCSTNGFVTYSQGGWGSKPNGNNPGMLLKSKFSTVYEDGYVKIGTPGTLWLKFTSAQAIENFLPQGGTPKVLTSSATNPTSSSAGNFAAQLLALQLAVDFSEAGVTKEGLGALVMLGGPLAGRTVDDILVLANKVIGGQTSALPSGMSVSGLSSVLESIIMNFHEGTEDGGLLGCGDPTEPPCVATTFTFNQNQSSGSAGNVRTFNANGTSVKAMAFSRDKSNGAWAKGFAGAFGAYGLGVTDSSENGSGTSHTVDNNGRNNYLVFIFDEPVVVTKALLGWVDGDSDAQVWVGTLPNAFVSTPTFSDALLNSLGEPETSTGGSSARWMTFNEDGVAGNVVVIAAHTAQSNDYFKIAKLEAGCDQVVAAPSISLVKKTNGTNNNSAPGVEVLAGSTVTWTYDITNTGNVALTNLVLSDDKIGVVSCPVSSLAAGASTTCTATGTAITGQYANMGTVTARPPVGPNVTAQDPDHYFGKTPTPPCVATTFTMNINENQGAGTLGNVRSFTAGGAAMKVMSFSRDKSTGSWAKAFTGAFSVYGLGVTDSGENGSGTSHTVDNNGRNNYIVFVFDRPVVVKTATLGYVSGDSDAQVWVGTIPTAYATAPMLSDSLLSSLGSPETSLGGSSARTINFNSVGESGNVVVIAALTTESNDYFKVAKLESVCASTPPPSDDDDDEDPVPVCAFRTQTQGGWGSSPNGSNPGAFLESHFSSVFGTAGVTIGGSKKLTFTSASAVRNFLPQGGTASKLTSNGTNVTNSSAGVFAGQVLALKLSVAFSNEGVTPEGLGGLKVKAGPLAGKTVAQVLAMAETALGGGTVSGVSISTLNSVVDAINNNFVDGTTNKGYLLTGDCTPVQEDDHNHTEGDDCRDDSHKKRSGRDRDNRNWGRLD